MRSTCRHCHGEGRIISTPCKECRGTGTTTRTQTVTVQVPAGMKVINYCNYGNYRNYEFITALCNHYCDYVLQNCYPVASCRKWTNNKDVGTVSHAGHGEQDKSGENRPQCPAIGSLFPHP